jgi:hypothetical protein
MMRNLDRLIIAGALGLLGATAANAQAGTPSGVPGSGDSMKITNGNRENNAAYNHVLATGVKSQNAEDRPTAQKKSAAGPATSADIKTGAPLRDKDGVPIGTIDTVEADGAVVNTGQTKIKVPLVAFGKDGRGLLLGITAARFNELVAKAHSSN